MSDPKNRAVAVIPTDDRVCALTVADAGVNQILNPERSRASSAVFVSLGLLLVLAAVLKTHQLFSVPYSAWQLSSSLFVVWCELIFGTWLIVGARTRGMRRAAVICFSIFAFVAAYKALTGVESCGCFGLVKVHPFLTLVIDTVAVLALLFGQVRKHPQRGTSRMCARLSFTLAITLAAIVTAGIVVRQSSFTKLETTNGQDPGGLVILSPEEWTGQRCPLFDHMSPDDVAKLSQGAWVFMLVRNDCHVCHSVMSQLEQALLEGRENRSIALIPIDHISDDVTLASLQELGCTVAEMGSARDWFVHTPTQIQVIDGRCAVAEVIEQWSSVSNVESL